MRVRCTNCGTEYTLSDGSNSADYSCSVCNHDVLVPIPSAAASPVMPLSGAVGGAALGAALGGPVGAVIGGLLGLLIGTQAQQQQ